MESLFEAHHIKQRIENWLKYVDPTTKQEMLKLQKKDPKQLYHLFSQDLDFGTGGLRGTMGLGTAQINPYTIALISQSIANYLKKLGLSHPILIGYDPRNHSEEFAKITAEVFAGNGFSALILPAYASVALLSFGIRFKQCSCGILITCSHNPPEYNGYKLFWSDGSQVISPHDQKILEEKKALNQDLSQIKRADPNSVLIHPIGNEIFEAYLKAIHLPQKDLQGQEELKILYSPLHGGGKELVKQGLASWGFSNVDLVEAQSSYDGNFPTVKVPNPEDPAALSLGIDLLKQGYDLFLATDPDVDRLGVVFLDHEKPYTLTGNEIGVLLLSHLLKTRKTLDHSVCVKTIVTTELFAKICQAHQIPCLDVLTGFKYIGQLITEFEKTHEHQFLFGCEESFGYLYSTHARDKDAVIAACLMSELALNLKKEQRTLKDALFDLYKQYGIYREKLLSFTYPHPFSKIRGELKKQLLASGLEIVLIEDFVEQTKTACLSNQTSVLKGFPTSSVLRLWLNDNTKLVIRPSGTEPKVKLYCGCFSPYHSNLDLEKRITSLDTRSLEYLEKIKSIYTKI